VRQQSWIETGILFASGAGFGHRQIHWIKATGDAPVGQENEGPFPSFLSPSGSGRRSSSALGVLTNAAVDQIGKFGCPQRIDVMDSAGG